MELSRLLAVSRGDEPADVILCGARVVDVFSAELHRADIAIAGGVIVGVGAGYDALEIVDLGGRTVAPGFIDAHVHVESAMVPPRHFASVVVPHGVTTAITDPHEIANVLGLDGIRFMLGDARATPLAMLINASSCVPATHLATSGAELEAADLAALLREGEVLGLAEVMNFPGVVGGDPAILAKLRAFAGRPIDGHCPGLGGPALSAYVAAGIESDHECTTVEEARRKVRLGMTIFVREGTVAKNLATLLPLVTPANQQHFCWCTDDKQISDLIREGSIDHLIRKAVQGGLDPVTAIRMATIHPARHYRLSDRGAIAPGRRADLVVFDDLQDVRAAEVYVAGRCVARDGVALFAQESRPARAPAPVRVAWNAVELAIPVAGRLARTIGVIPEQLVTEHLVEPVAVRDSQAVADPSRDLLKMAVVERHRGTGRVGRGFVRGMGLARGAIAGTVAHDHHNLVLIGADERSMRTAGRAVAEDGGGLAVADGDAVLARLPLPIAGLMSERPPGQVAGDLDLLVRAARALGSPLSDPFMTMSFLALEVIPHLKLTDHGLVDVGAMRIVPLFVEEGVI